MLLSVGILTVIEHYNVPLYIMILKVHSPIEEHQFLPVILLSRAMLL